MKFQSRFLALILMDATFLLKKPNTWLNLSKTEYIR